jgi:hypothetical protein
MPSKREEIVEYAIIKLAYDQGLLSSLSDNPLVMQVDISQITKMIVESKDNLALSERQIINSIKVMYDAIYKISFDDGTFMSGNIFDEYEISVSKNSRSKTISIRFSYLFGKILCRVIAEFNKTPIFIANIRSGYDELHSSLVKSVLHDFAFRCIRMATKDI